MRENCNLYLQVEICTNCTRYLILSISQFISDQVEGRNVADPFPAKTESVTEMGAG